MTAPYSSSRFVLEGAETTETSIVRTGGARDPAGQAQSRKILTTATCQWLRPFRCEPWAIWNETVGADVTVTVYGLAKGLVLTTCDVWLEIEYLGDVSSTLGKVVTTTRANISAACAPIAADSSIWASGSSYLVGAHTVFDQHTASAQVRLSNNDLTATLTSNSSNSGARSVDYRSTGKYYFEFTAGTGTGGVVGVVAQNVGYGVYFGQNTGGHVSYGNGAVLANGVGIGNVGAAATPGVVYGIAVDLGARKFWGRRNGGLWNGNAGDNPVTGVGGGGMASATPFAPFVSLGDSAGPSGLTGDSMTLNTGQTPYAFTPPAGYGNWDADWTPYKLVATLSSPQPGRPGLIHVRPKIGKASATIYLDPQIELTPASAAPSATHKSSRYAYEGTETTETSIVRSGGTPHSRKIVTTANTQWLRPYRAEPFAIWNATTGADVTVTVYGNAATLPLNDEIFMDVEYFNTTHGTIVSTTKTNVLATGVSVASDASSWAGGTTAFKLVATLSSPQPGQPGLINVRVRAAKASSTFYIDPTPELT